MAFKWLEGLFAKTPACLCNTPVKDLSQASPGRLFIKALSGEESSNQRLREMGFGESAVIEKISESGALLCKTGDSKVVLSKDLAKNIIVQEVCPVSGHQQPQGAGKAVLLNQMSMGQRGRIEDFAAGSDDCERLEEMGLTPGEVVEIVRYAPLGDPIEIKVRGYNLSLRRQEAQLIKVKLF